MKRFLWSQYHHLKLFLYAFLNNYSLKPEGFKDREMEKNYWTGGMEMIIHSLMLNNFRQFTDEQTIEFSTDPNKKVILIIKII